MRAAQMLVSGYACGQVLATRTPLSFWGGVDPATGTVIDRHHELCGRNLTGKVLLMPSGRGSCTGSVVLLECIQNGKAPCAILLREPDEIITLGVILAEELYAMSIPVCVLTEETFREVLAAEAAEVHADGTIRVNTRLTADGGML